MKMVCITNKIKGKNLSNQLFVGKEYEFRVYEYDRQTIYFLTSVRDELSAWLRFTSLGGVDCIWLFYYGKNSPKNGSCNFFPLTKCTKNERYI